MKGSIRRDLERERAQKLLAAEARTGFAEGGFVWRGQPVKVHVNFYPKEVWWLEPVGGEKQKLTKELWAECSRLQL